MLEIKNLSKRYKNSNYYSVKDLNITINDGEIFGFLGKNGAGKSTTIKCLTGILPFEEGSIKVCGYDIMKEPIKAKLNIGYVPDNHAVYENLTGKEYVNYMGNIYRVPKDQIKSRLDEFASLFNMTGAIDRQIRSYSHGMKQKICIIAALIHNPKFWVLDEPLMGLDPQSTAEIKGYMLEHKRKGNSVFFSSHNIDMVEKLCDRVAIINHGQLMEIIEVEKFVKESPVSLEEYFLNMTKDNLAPVIEISQRKKRSSKGGNEKKLAKQMKGKDEGIQKENNSSFEEEGEKIKNTLIEDNLQQEIETEKIETETTQEETKTEEIKKEIKTEEN